MMAQYQDEWNRRNNDTRRENNINSNSTRADIADANNDSREKIAQGHDATSRANQKMRSGNKAGGAQNLDEKSINKQIETLNKQMGDLRKPNSMTGMVPPDDMIRSSEQWYQSQIQALEQKKSQLKGGGSQASGLPVRAVSKQDVANAPEGALIQWSGAGIPQGMYKKQGGHLVPAN